MSKPKKKWYVVWRGHEPGVYDNWEDAKKQVDKFPQPSHKSFLSLAEAQAAFKELKPAQTVIKGIKDNGFKRAVIQTKALNASAFKPPIKESISVDAACAGNPGLMEYRGVDNVTNTQVFHLGPLKNGTNNIGEFLAIVHALAWLKNKGQNIPIYSDSVIAIGWVKQKKARTELPRTADTESVWELLDRAVVWLKNNTWSNPILKWETKTWGENPADFGRKG